MKHWAIIGVLFFGLLPRSVLPDCSEELVLLTAKLEVEGFEINRRIYRAESYYEYAHISLGLMDRLASFTYRLAGLLRAPVLDYGDFDLIRGVEVGGSDIAEHSVEELVQVFLKIIERHPDQLVIHFNLDGFAVLEALGAGPYANGVTSREFKALLMSDELLSRTAFYLNFRRLTETEKQEFLDSIRSKIRELRGEVD